MKISEYNQMMAYLTRPPTNQVAGLVDELEPGPLKDELQEKFDSNQETYEEYLQRTRLGERPFNAAEGGSPTVAEDTFTLEDFQKSADGLVQGSFGGMRKGIEGIKLLKDTMDELITKALDSGAIKSKKEAIDFILEREKYYTDLIESEKTKGVEVPVLSRDDFAIGGGAFVGRDLGTREGFNKIDKRTLKGLDVERRDQIKQILLDEIENFELNLKKFPNEKYQLNKENLNKIIKEKTGKGADSTTISNTIKDLDKNIKEKIFETKVGQSSTTSLTKKEIDMFNNNYNKKTISQMATEITGLPYDNKITKAKSAQIYRYYIDLTKKGFLSKEDIARGTRPKGSTLGEKGFSGYRKAQQDLMNLDPELYKDLTPSQVDARLKKAINFSKVRGAFDVPTSLIPSFEHFQGIVPGTITQDPEALRKVGITTRDFNFNVLGAKAKNNIYKTIKNELRTARESIKLKDKKLAKESLDNINKIYDDIAKKLKTVDRSKLPKYNLLNNTIKETNLKTIDMNTQKRLGNVIEDYIKFVAAGPTKDIKKIKQPNLIKAIKLVKKGDDQAVKNLINSRLPAVRSGQLFSKLLPGLEQIAEGIKNIPDDIKKKKFFTLGLKALGPIGTYIAVDDTYEALKAGKPVAEALEYGLIGTNAIGYAKDVMALSPEEREARSIVKQAEMTDKIAQDESMLDTDFQTPTIKSDLTREEAEKKFKAAMAKRKMERESQEADIARARAINIQGLKDLITGKRFMGQEIPTEYMAVGGRVGFADGPDDPNKRKFMKVLGGLTALPFVGKFFKAAEPAAEVAPKIVEGAKTIPPYFFKLVDKIKKFGEDATRYLKSSEREKVTSYRTSDADYELYEDLNTGSMQVKIIKGDPDLPGYKQQELTLTKGQTDEATGFVPNEYDEYTVKSDFDGKMKDIDEGLDDIDDLIEELGPENISVKELEDMGYDVNRLGPTIKKKLGIK